jgi:glucose-1-phosphate thymidylyltransferase
MKGIILAGGLGTRLYPITQATCKQLLPIYDKPMIYYPICTLMQANIREILLITTAHDQPRFQELLGNGEQWGISLSFAIQEVPRGIADAFRIGEEFIGRDTVALILGDNLFYGPSLDQILSRSATFQSGAKIFGYEVQDPTRYGVLALNGAKEVVGIIEKPQIPPSRYAVTGLYFYDHRVIDMARALTPSKRGELEITDVNNAYLEQNALHCHLLERGVAWLDTGTPEAMQKQAPTSRRSKKGKASRSAVLRS